MHSGSWNERHKGAIVSDVLERGKGAANTVAAAPSSPSAKRPEPIRGRSSVSMVVHKERPPIWHKGGILVSPAFVVFMLLSSPLSMGVGLLSHSRGRANNNRSRRGLGRRHDDLIELHLLRRCGLIGDG